jgi:hypothetical protein
LSFELDDTRSMLDDVVALGRREQDGSTAVYASLFGKATLISNTSLFREVPLQLFCCACHREPFAIEQPT